MKIFGKSFTEFLIEQYRYVLVAVALILALVGYLVFIGPELQEVRRFGTADLKDEKSKLEDRKTYLTRLQGMLDAYSTLNQNSLSELEGVLPTYEDIPDLFIIVEDLAKQSGLSLSSVSINPANLESESSAAGASTTSLSQLAKSKNLKAFDISVTAINGTSYEDFKDFITNIENSNRLFDVRSMQFTPEPRQSADRTSETSAATTPYSINLRTYYIDGEEAS
ncbi:MAG: hypothetical protein H6760_00900 [Candidatus Nomurabacteria bacterium]|nr:MAG: hypothetical protein H6760_00900 [Candidatus Nomurabacteria bacterium]